MKSSDIKEIPFNERAKKFKEAIIKAEEKYGVRINAGYINSWVMVRIFLFKNIMIVKLF